MRAADEQVELRAEYRSVVGRRRLFAWRVRLLCRRCAMEDWLAHNKPQGAQGQGTLFG
jgi:hypothetical protein